MNVSEQLKAFIELKHISKKQLAEEVNLSLSVVYNATKKGAFLSSANFHKICETYSVPSFYFSSFDVQHPAEQFRISERICYFCNFIRHKPLELLISPAFLPYIDIKGITDRTHFPSVRELAVILYYLKEVDFESLYIGRKVKFENQSNPSEFQILCNEISNIIDAISSQENEKAVVENVLSKISDKLIYESSFGNKTVIVSDPERKLIIDASYLTKEDEKEVIRFAKILSDKNMSIISATKDS